MENSGEIKTVVVVGGGQAGAQAIISLRQGGYQGEIVLIGEEPVLPYQRPPLSKAYMKGNFEEARLYLRPAEWYAQNDVTLKFGRRAVSLDISEKKVKDDHDDVYSYDRLILATGSRPRIAPFPGVDLANVFDLRTLADVDKIRPQMKEGRKLVIVGAGYIGLEAAAVARSLGLEVSVVEAAERVLARVTSPVISAFYQSVHKTEGVNIFTGESIAKLNGEDGAVRGVLLASGEELDADIVLIGIGIVPNEELARDAGIACDNGVMVDRDARTSDPSIYAVGDCAQRPLVYHAGRARLESVHNAIEQGKLAAASILDRPRPLEECPWFWSDQYDLKLQIAGLSAGYDQHIVRGDPAENKFAVFYLKDGQLIAVDAINSPPEFLMSKKLIAAGARPLPERLADQSVNMKDIAVP